MRVVEIVNKNAQKRNKKKKKIVKKLFQFTYMLKKKNEKTLS